VKNDETPARRYSIVHPWALSFFSKDLYRDVAANWKGFGLLYLLSLLALCTIPGALTIDRALTDWIDRDAPKIIRQVPAVTVSHGTVSVDVPQPYTIRDEAGRPLVIIDTTGKTTSLEQTEAVALLTKTELIVRDSGRKTRSLSLTDVADLRINRDDIYRFADSMRDLFLPIFYPFAVIFAFVVHLVEVLVFSAAGLLLARSVSPVLGYKTIFRLTAVAVTPAVIIDAVLVLAALQLPHWWLIRSALNAGYLFFAVKANDLRQ
jgi:hypothetical protein